MPESVVTVVIGRNEGERLTRCLASLKAQDCEVIYVDSGSTDGSVENARSIGADVIELDLSIPFTAARARNAGFARARQLHPEINLVQCVDGDCELSPGWIAAAVQTMRDEPELAAVYGRQRERFPEATIWNGLMDMEWDTPVGLAEACGGNALYRLPALDEVGGFRDDLIAGEEPEMCFRLRQRGWRIRRIEANMAFHDAAMTRFRQWWHRTRRAGHSYAALAALHGHSEERFRVVETRRALLWGLGLPLVAVLGMFVTPWSLLLLALWPVQVLRLRLRGEPWISAFFLTLGKIAEAWGVVEFNVDKLLHRSRNIIDYKST